MSTLRNLTFKQIQGMDWSNCNLGANAFKHNTAALNKILQSYPSQVASFLKYFGDSELIDNIGVDKFCSLVKRADKDLKFKGVFFHSVLQTKNQFPQEIIEKYSAHFDLSTLYTQDFCTKETFKKFKKDIDLIGAILYYTSTEKEKNNFITDLRYDVIAAMREDINSYCVSCSYLERYDINMHFEPKESNIRDNLITEELIQELNLFELNSYIGSTVDNAAYKMNLKDKQHYAALMVYVKHLLG